MNDHRGDIIAIEKPARARQLLLECKCPRKARASKKVCDQGQIWCGICGEMFERPEIREDKE